MGTDAPTVPQIPRADIDSPLAHLTLLVGRLELITDHLREIVHEPRSKELLGEGAFEHLSVVLGSVGTTWSIMEGLRAAMARDNVAGAAMEAAQAEDASVSPLSLHRTAHPPLLIDVVALTAAGESALDDTDGRWQDKPLAEIGVGAGICRQLAELQPPILTVGQWDDRMEGTQVSPLALIRTQWVERCVEAFKRNTPPPTAG